MKEEFTLHEAIALRRTCRSFLAEAVSEGAIRRLLRAGQGVTDSPGNRTVPSAHALHPLRLFVAVGNIERHEPGLFAAATDGTLTLVRDHDVRAELQECALDDQPWIGQAAAVITICADFVAPAHEFAEQPPYGVRGRRYVYIESGAAAQNVALQATAEGLGCVLVAGLREDAAANVLELESPYMPVLHLCLGVPSRE